jgi:hypothetical protein
LATELAVRLEPEITKRITHTTPTGKVKIIRNLVYGMMKGYNKHLDEGGEPHDLNSIIKNFSNNNPRNLICSCCDGPAVGRQWHLRDTGYGLCDRCAKIIVKKETAMDMRVKYGFKRVHYLIPLTPELQLHVSKTFNES